MLWLCLFHISQPFWRYGECFFSNPQGLSAEFLAIWGIVFPQILQLRHTIVCWFWFAEWLLDLYFPSTLAVGVSSPVPRRCQGAKFLHCLVFMFLAGRHQGCQIRFDQHIPSYPLVSSVTWLENPRNEWRFRSLGFTSLMNGPWLPARYVWWNPRVNPMFGGNLRNHPQFFITGAHVSSLTGTPIYCYPSINHNWGLFMLGNPIGINPQKYVPSRRTTFFATFRKRDHL